MTKEIANGGEPLAPLDELIELGERMRRDKARLIELCRQISGGEAAVRKSAIERPRPARRGRQRKAAKVNQVNGVNQVLNSSGEKIRKEYWRKVRCSICGVVTGAVRKGDGVGALYPIRHKNYEIGGDCKGMDLPAALVTKE